MKPYYQDSHVTIYHGDCREIVPQLGRFDLLLTDPPYGAGYASNPVVGKGKTKSNHERQTWDNSRPDLKFLINISSTSIVWGGNYFELPSRRRWLAWIKRDAPPSLSNVELAWTSLDANAKFFDYPIAATNSERIGHPTQKPLALMKWCLCFVPEAKTILDPFAGSGTTGRAAKDLNKISVLIEIEERYCEIAASRMSQEVLAL